MRPIVSRLSQPPSLHTPSKPETNPAARITSHAQVGLLALMARKFMLSSLLLSVRNSPLPTVPLWDRG
jgi:hypothetical protein